MLAYTLKAIALFPVSIYRVSFWLPRRLMKPEKETNVKTAAGLIFYVLFGIPATIAILFEVLILINSQIVGEAPNYQFSVTEEEMLLGQDIELPGYEPVQYISPVSSNREQYYSYLLKKYSPSIIHKMGHNPLWDIPTDIFFDGDKNPRNNVRNAAKTARLPPVIHAEVIAETDDSYYLAYMLYHIKDYDQPLREFLTHWTYHDSDNEGFQLRIDKSTMTVAHVEAWYHNRFFLCNSTGKSLGSEPIQSLSLFEGQTHIVIYAQSMGHGVRCATRSDLTKISNNTKIMRYQPDAKKLINPTVSRETQHNTGYTLSSLKPWYRHARKISASGEKSTSLFEGKIHLGTYENGEEIYIGRYIAGEDYDRNAWSRPKPPWSWDDKWDDVPIFLWHFYPSFAFGRHAEGPLSNNYIYNAPMELTFNINNTNEILPFLKLEMATSSKKKWDNLEWRSKLVSQNDLWAHLKFRVKQYINYIFNALG